MGPFENKIRTKLNFTNNSKFRKINITKRREFHKQKQKYGKFHKKNNFVKSSIFQNYQRRRFL